MFKRKARKLKPDKPDPRTDAKQMAALEALDRMGAEAATELALIELLRIADKKVKP